MAGQGLELGSDAMASNNSTDSAEGFWFVNCEIDGRYDYYKCPNTNPPSRRLADGTLCAKSKCTGTTTAALTKCAYS